MKQLMALLCLLAGACASIDDGSDFDRHRYSQLVMPFDRPGLMYFDVSYPATYPADDPDAERSRMRWLEGWLQQRGLCPAGYEIIRQRPFDYLEDNPRRHEQRYEVRCQMADAAG